MYNILINNLSLIRPSLSQYALNVDGEDKAEFSGICTNEPITKALIHKFAKKGEGERLDLVYSLTTSKVQQEMVFPHPDKLDSRGKDSMATAMDYLGISEEEISRLTHYQLYEQLIGKAVREEYDVDGDLADKMPELCNEQIPNIPESMDINAAVLQMASKIISIYKENSGKCSLYIDYTGGDRMTSTILIALTKMLEERGILVDHIWAVNFDGTSQTTNEIREKMEVNYIFDFISGLNEFRRYGRADILDKYLRASEKRGFIHFSNEAKNVQKKIRQMADAIQLCRPNEMIDGIAGLTRSLVDYEDKAQKNKDVREPIFDYMILDIRDNYSQIFAEEDRTIPNVVRWCLDRNLVMQAVAIYSDMVPEEIVKNSKIIYPESNGWRDVLNNKGKTGFKDSYAYMSDYLWREVVYFKSEGRGDNSFYIKKGHILAEEILKPQPKERYDDEGNCFIKTKIKPSPEATDALAAFLTNYFNFKEKVRNVLAHASSKNIWLPGLRDGMVWDDDSIFCRKDGSKIKQMSVPLLKKMMRQLLTQLDRVLEMAER